MPFSACHIPKFFPNKKLIFPKDRSFNNKMIEKYTLDFINLTFNQTSNFIVQ